MDGLLEDTDIEDDRKHPRLSVALKFISLWCFTLCFWFILSLFFLPLFISGLIVWGSPPIAPSLSAFCKYFVAVFTEGNAKENIPFTNRVLVFLITLDTLFKTPVQGVLVHGRGFVSFIPQG